MRTPAQPHPAAAIRHTVLLAAALLACWVGLIAARRPTIAAITAHTAYPGELLCSNTGR